MRSPKISVIMPVFNAEKYIKEGIESVLNQSFKDFELIIVNDSSADGSKTIAEDYAQKDPRVISISNRENKGLAGALNTGLKQARGAYIARLDADDINIPDRLLIQYIFLETHKDIHLVGGGYAPFNENGHRVNIFHPASSIEIAWRFISNTFFCHPSVMFRREVVDDIRSYPNVGAEDFAFFSRIVRKYRCANLKKILIRYREHQTNYSVTAKERILESVKNTFKENYLHYMGNYKYAEMFFLYQKENKLAIKNIFMINMINFQILNKIRKQYKIPLLSAECIRFALLLQIKNYKAILSTILKSINK